MKKVALELQPCCSQKSGIGYYTYEIAKRLKNNQSYTFYGNVFNFMNRNKLDISEINYDIFTNKKLPYGVYRRIWNYINLSYEKMFANNADIKHFFNYIVPPKVKGKVIDTIHDLGFIYYPEFLDKKNLSRIKRDINYSIERSDVIVTVSNSVKNEIIENLKINEDKIKVVYNGITVEEDYLDQSYIQQKWNVIGDYLLYIGNIEPRKNLSRLIRAYDYLKKNNNISMKLIIAGQAMWNSKEVFREVEELNLKNDIVFTGYVNELEKNTLYKYCKIFVFPSLYEGFGIPVVDALKFNKPVVCSDIPVFKEITNNSAYFIEPVDIKDIAEKMNIALEEQKDNMVNIVDRFNWDNSVSEIMKIYDLLTK